MSQQPKRRSSKSAALNGILIVVANLAPNAGDATWERATVDGEPMNALTPHVRTFDALARKSRHGEPQQNGKST